jgi:hypothetical protein
MQPLHITSVTCRTYWKESKYKYFLSLYLVIFSDHVFDITTKNYEVFNTIARPIVDSSVGGFNGTIFAYGQTSSGNYLYMCVLHPVI